MKNFTQSSILICCLLICSITTFSQTSWTGVTSTDWTDGTNWSTGTAPTALTDVIIGDASFTGTFQPAVSAAALAKTLTVGGTVAATLTVSAALAVGNVYINANGTVSHGAATVSTTGNWTNDGTYTANANSAVTFNGAIQYIGGTSLTTFRTLNISSTNTVTLTSNIALNSSNLSAGVINIQAGTFDLSTFTANRGTSVAGGTISISGGAFLKIGGTNGFPANYASNPINAISTVEYNGANQLIASRIYGNLVLSSSSGAVVKTAVSNIIANGYINIGTSTTFNGGSFSHSVAGNWINDGSFAAGTSTVTFKGASGISGNSVQSFYNVAVTGSLDLDNSGTVEIRDLSIGVGASLILADATLKIAGTIVSSGIFNASLGILEMNGTAAQAIPADAFLSNAVDNLVINNSSIAGVTLNGAVDIYGALTYTGIGRNLTTNDFLTLKSTVDGTARTGDMTGNAVTGNVTIERYVPGNRAWRFLTSPVTTSSAQTIHDAWQEGVNNTSLITNNNPNPGFGTHITKGNDFAAGFDVGINNNAGIKGYNDATGTWEPLTSTNIDITDYPAYMVFVRGDRSTNLSLGLNAPPTPTVLRPSGELNIGNQPFVVAATGFTVIKNPFASAMSINDVAKSLTSVNIQDNFYLWDPKFEGGNGVGVFVNFSWDALNTQYDITPSTGTGISEFISSGAAFLAKSADNLTPGLLVIKEADKVATGGNDDVVNRPALLSNTGKLRTSLYSVNTDGTTAIVDGVLNSYGVAYSNAIDNNDAVKFSNFTENLSTTRNGHQLTVERRQPLTTDTINYNMMQMRSGAYTFELTAGDLGNGSLGGFFEDNYLHTSTPVNLNGTTTINFTVTAAAGSWAPDRFRMVFRPLAPLPLTMNSIKAWQKNDAIEVEWKVENEKNIRQYEIERSGDGISFDAATSVKAANTNGVYNWLDINAKEGNNYYRIKSVGLNGEVMYSSVVKIYMGQGKGELVLNTKIITGSAITFQLNNMPKGRYGIRLLNNLGQVMHKKQITHAEGSSTQSIDINTNLAKGIYLVEFTTPDNKKITEKVIN